MTARVPMRLHGRVACACMCVCPFHFVVVVQRNESPIECPCTAQHAHIMTPKRVTQRYHRSNRCPHRMRPHVSQGNVRTLPQPCSCFCATTVVYVAFKIQAVLQIHFLWKTRFCCCAQRLRRVWCQPFQLLKCACRLNVCLLRMFCQNVIQLI